MTNEDLAHALRQCHLAACEMAEFCGFLISTMADGEVLLEDGIKNGREALLAWHRIEGTFRDLIADCETEE
jgi:hypothetical protein